ncbi:MAG: AbrB/MazE/SpoVT family DNA-binding domain-containing protein [Chloroflexota bacterium]|nr:AbrB/MazE/SpoVT family DNA-binding domain-containing protein [Chloroflexota bacterium]
MTISEATRQDTVDVVLDAEGRITLPAWLIDQVGLKAGDKLAVSVVEDGVALASRRLRAQRALREIRESFAASGITEGELQEEGRKVREELVRERYGIA